MGKINSEPPFTPAKNKRVSVYFRVSQDLYERIKAASAASGRSMASEMDYRLERQHKAESALCAIQKA